MGVDYLGECNPIATCWISKKSLFLDDLSSEFACPILAPKVLCGSDNTGIQDYATTYIRLCIMSHGRSVHHFEHVDLRHVRSCFFDERSHRAYLQIPFVGDRGEKTLCAIGQNPSSADEHAADKTVRYLEELVYRSLPQYRQLIVLNLYSRVDTSKEDRTSPLHPECSNIFDRFVAEETDFLVVFGQLRNKEPYRFQDRAREIAPLLRSKHVFKLDIGAFYAPHPGNPKIIYSNFTVGFTPYTFADVSYV